MNFNPNFIGPVTVNPPIIHRRFNDVGRVFITEQPHIIEDITRIHNHHILRHTCCVRPMCCEFNTFSVENCCNIPMGGPFMGGIGGTNLGSNQSGLGMNPGMGSCCGMRR
mgnify:CR=1 FL=1